MATINIFRAFGRAATHALELPVTVNGMVIRVGKGNFRHCGNDYTLADDVDFTVSPDGAHMTALFASLVRVKTDDSIEVVVDEMLQDGIDRIYEFDGSPYENLGRIFTCEIPSGITDLDAVVVNVRHVIERLERVTPKILPPRVDVPFVPPKMMPELEE